LTCDCDIVINGEVQRKPFPCLEETDKKFHVVKVLPLIMTNLLGSITFNGAKENSNFHKVYEKEWTNLTTIHNMTRKGLISESGIKVSNVTLPEKMEGDGDDSWISTDTWLYMLSVVVGLIVFERFVSCCYNRNSLPRSLLPVFMANHIPPAKALNERTEDVIRLANLLAFLVVVFILIWILRLLTNVIAGLKRNGNMEMDCAVARNSAGVGGLPSAPSLPFAAEGPEYRDGFVVPAGTYICMRRMDEYYPLVNTPLKVNSVVMFAN